MDSNLRGISQPGIKGLSHEPYAPAQTKSTATGAPAATSNPELAAWFEEATAYYNAVMAGDPSTPRPPEADWANFMAQLQWAQTQLYGAQGAPGTLGMGGGMGQAQGPQTNQFGGTTGTMDNWVYTNENNRIGFTGDGTHDVWGNLELDVAPTSADVVIENTTDTRFAPNESVVKVTVTDPATGTQAVYFVHDYNPATDTIKVNTPDSATQVNNLTGDSTSITTGKFTPGGAGAAGSHPDASIEGVVQESDGKIVYEPEFSGGTIDFWANPGESQVHVAYSDANISVKPSDEVTVSLPDATTGVITVVVTHSDNTTDTYEVQRGYKVNVNANAEYIQFNGHPGSEGVPADMSARVTLNGGVAADGATTGAVDAQAVIDSLQANLTGNKDNQLFTALEMAGYKNPDGTKIDTIEELKNLIPDNFPGQPDDKLFNLLRILDPTGLGKAVSDLAATHDPEDDAVLYKAVTDSLMELMGPLYPNDIISPSGTNDYSFQFNGTTYEWGVTPGTGACSLSEA